MKPILGLRSFLIGSAFLAAAPLGYGSTIYWDGATTPASWNIASNWSTDPGGAATPDPAAVPGANDNVVFNNTSSNANNTNHNKFNETITLDASQAAKSLTFNNGGTTTLLGGTTAQVLTLGVGGITKTSGSGKVTFGDGTAANNVTFSLVPGSQTWSIVTSDLVINNTAASFSRVTGSTLNFSATSGNFVITAAALPNDSTGIIGNWAFHGTTTAMDYAFNNATIISGFGVTASAPDSWNSPTANYSSTNNSTETISNANRAFNTLRYTGTGKTITFGIDAGSTLTINGILAVGSSGTLNFNRTGTTSIVIGTSNELIIAGQQNVSLTNFPITGASGALTYAGTATLTLSSGASTYGKATTISRGILSTGSTGTLANGGSPSSIGQSANTAANLVIDGGTLLYANTGAAQSTDRLFTLTDNGGTLDASGTNSITFAGNGAGAANAIAYSGTSTRTLTLTGTGIGTLAPILADNTGATSLTKSGNGTWIVSNANTYTGATTINTGTLQLDGSTHASSTVGIGTAGILTGSGTVNGNATLTGSGIINKSSGAIAGTLAVTGGNWNGSGSVTGLVTSSSNTFTIGNSANLTANAGLNVTGGSIAAGNSASTITGSVNYTSGTSSTFAGVIAGSGKTLTMNNSSATLTLGGANTYNGATAVNGGILALAAAGSIDNTSGVVLGSGTFDVSAKGVGGYSVGNLSGSGTVIGALTVSTSLGIGTSPSTTGIVSFQTLTLAAASTSTFKLTGGGITGDLGKVFTKLTLSSTAALNLDLVPSSTYTLLDKFTLFSYPTGLGNLTGTFNGLAEGTTFTDAGGLWRINYADSTSGSNFTGSSTGLSFINVTAVPEPSAALLSGLSLLALLRRRRN